MTTKTTTVRNAFSNLSGTYRATADADGTVRVWDSVAKHWTIVGRTRAHVYWRGQ